MSGVIDSGDTAWVLTSSALVFLMTLGLALFYAGLVRRKNVLSVLMQCFMLMGLMTLQWVFIGYSLSFGPDVGGLIGNLDWFALRGEVRGLFYGDEFDFGNGLENYVSFTWFTQAGAAFIIF